LVRRLGAAAQGAHAGQRDTEQRDRARFRHFGQLELAVPADEEVLEIDVLVGGACLAAVAGKARELAGDFLDLGRARRADGIGVGERRREQRHGREVNAMLVEEIALAQHACRRFRMDGDLAIV
jgi:hypothetical protein